jgi:hypothetical protein
MISLKFNLVKTTSRNLILSLFNGVNRIEIGLANEKSDAHVALTWPDVSLDLLPLLFNLDSSPLV